MSDDSNYSIDSSIPDNIDMKNFYYHNNFYDLNEQQKIITKNIFDGFHSRINFRNFGIAFPEDEIFISSSPYQDIVAPIPFTDLCRAIKICTDRYVNNQYYDNGIKVSNSYYWNSKSIVTIYIPIKYANNTFVYFIKYDVPTSSYFSSLFNFRIDNFDLTSNKEIYLRPKKELDSIFSIKLKESFERNGIKINYDVKIPLLLILDERDLAKLLAILFLIFLSVYNVKIKHKHKAHLDRVKIQSSIDSLTGVYNRNYFDEYRKIKFSHTKYALISIDGNRIKYFNDNYGHKVGDDAIKIIASALKNNFREEDLIFRLGGDEFLVIVIGNCDVGKLDMIIERLHSSLSLSEVLKGQVVSISCGIAFSEEANDFETVLKLSDSRMFEDKEKLLI
ncbi:GGDEF domain-containing protein [Vibrio sp. 10N.247.311.51]|uniref:GGDEF domain-containing protein n=1 Tax=Vibrio sp. 10N.247.311.51 TaxID=3229996 RepID=UPI003552447D